MGVATKTYQTPQEGTQFFGSFKTFGGTERDVNGLYSIEDTAQIECWFDPAITADCRVCVCDTGAIYEIMNEPEDINLRHQFMKFKVRRVRGGA